MRGHEGGVWSISFSPDGQTIASASSDETIKLWNVKTGCCIATLTSPRPYEGMNITDATGLAEATQITLFSLGAIFKENQNMYNFI